VKPVMSPSINRPALLDHVPITAVAKIRASV